VRRGTISQVTSSPAAAQHLRDLARLRRVRDRIDREYAQALDVEALARGVNMSAGHLSRGDLSVTEVCFAVGCASLGTFSTRFTELVGVPPSTYRGQTARATAGMPSCVAEQVTRPIRNREARVTEPQLA
jgi:AraC-like DNA-binding protein